MESFQVMAAPQLSLQFTLNYYYMGFWETCAEV
jgi:hypothetical protein